ncbi:HELQ family protein [Megaselia abdita]
MQRRIKRVRELSPREAETEVTSKQRRLTNKVILNASNIWNETDDSIFGNISLDFKENEDYLNVNIFRDLSSDSTICGDNLNHCQNEKEDISQSQLFEFNKTFKLPNDFQEEKPKDELQGTYKFFDDIRMDCSETIFKDVNISQTNVGTLYETRGDIQNSEDIKNHNLQGLSQIYWQTQAFEEEQCNFVSKGPFYGLPAKVEQLIYSSKGIKSLYDWQQECLSLPAINQRKNLIYALPTSGGKTLVSEILMLREVLCRNKNVLFVLPYVSIVQEKVSSMSLFALEMDFLIEEYTAGKGRCPPGKFWKRNSIFVASIEKAAVLFDSLIDSKRAGEIGMIVVDEMHLIGEKGRGCTLESFLTKAMFVNDEIQIVGMSATIGNLRDLSQFLNADVYTRNFRPVELKEFIKCGNDILSIDSNNKTSVEECFQLHRSINFKYNAQFQKVDPDHIAGLVSETAPAEGVLIFCSTRKNCQNVAILLTKLLSEQKFKNHRSREKKDLLDALEKICGVIGSILADTIPFGIAYHHSGLTTDERKYIEYAYRSGVLSVICCTSTLAAGVNLPAKRVIIRAPYVGSSFMMLSQYKQMVGRAGRAGMGGSCGESFIICSSKDNFKVAQMLTSPMTKVLSSMYEENAIGLQNLVLSAIGLNIAKCRRDLVKLAETTLLFFQLHELGGDSIEKTVLTILKTMHKHSVWEFNSLKAGVDLSVFSYLDQSLNTTNKFALCNTTKIQLTMIGKAAFKAGVDFIKAKAMAIELRNSQKCMVLTNYSHLLYLVISFNSNATGNEMFQTNVSILYREYFKLDENTGYLIKALGITEGQIIRMVKNMTTKGPVELLLNRLYKTLIITDIINLMPIHLVAQKYDIDRGMIQTLTNQCIVSANSIVRLCDQIEEFWCFLSLFERISTKLDKCGSVELEPLLELPAVKMFLNLQNICSFGKDKQQMYHHILLFPCRWFWYPGVQNQRALRPPTPYQ